MAKRGRKAKGPTTGLSGQPLSLRMPTELRERLEASAAKKGWSMSQEALYRIRSSYARAREDTRSPEVRALCYLIARLANAACGPAHNNEKERLMVNPFNFIAFKIGVVGLLDRLQPKGKPKPGWFARKAGISNPEEFGKLTSREIWKIPAGVIPFEEGAEEMLDRLKLIMDESEFELLKERGKESIYGYADAMRDLQINRGGDKK